MAINFQSEVIAVIEHVLSHFQLRNGGYLEVHIDITPLTINYEFHHPQGIGRYWFFIEQPQRPSFGKLSVIFKREEARHMATVAAQKLNCPLYDPNDMEVEL